MRNYFPARSLAMVVLFAAPAFSASSQVYCQLGPGANMFNPAYNQPPTQYAAQALQAIYGALCPNGCGGVQLFLNESTPNAMAAPIGPGTTMITYASAFMNQLHYQFGSESAIGVMAHEFGHHIDLHQSPPWMNNSWSRELKADAWAGCALARMGMQPAALAAALQAIAAYPSPSHPPWPQRVQAVEQGYVACGGQRSWLPWQ